MDPTSFYLGVSFGLMLYGTARAARRVARIAGREFRCKLRETKVELDVSLRLKEKPSDTRQIGEGDFHRRE